MKYTRNDLENIIAICEQDEDSKIAMNLVQRCKKALAYRDVSLRLTKNDKQLLSLRYDKDMDEDAKKTLENILKWLI